MAVDSGAAADSLRGGCKCGREASGIRLAVRAAQRSAVEARYKARQLPSVKITYVNVTRGHVVNPLNVERDYSRVEHKKWKKPYLVKKVA